MALTKVTYVDNQTVIDAAQLNAIQDEIIRVAEDVDATPSHLESPPRENPGIWRNRQSILALPRGTKGRYARRLHRQRQGLRGQG